MISTNRLNDNSDREGDDNIAEKDSFGMVDFKLGGTHCFFCHKWSIVPASEKVPLSVLHGLYWIEQLTKRTALIGTRLKGQKSTRDTIGTKGLRCAVEHDSSQTHEFRQFTNYDPGRRLEGWEQEQDDHEHAHTLSRVDGLICLCPMSSSAW
ncbi:hypothetical protein Tco_0477972 [Tanacetum coccineum]